MQHTSLSEQIKNERTRESLSRDIWLRVAVVMLLVAVAGLSTLAKNIQYFPKTSPTHYVSSSTKMKVVGDAPGSFSIEIGSCL